MKIISIILTVFLGILLPLTAFAEDPLSFPMREGSSSSAHKHNEEGIAHYKENNFDLALKHFQTAAKIDPTAGESHFNMALALGKLSRHDEAIRHFKLAQKHARGNKNILNSKIMNAHINFERS